MNCTLMTDLGVLQAGVEDMDIIFVGCLPIEVTPEKQEVKISSQGSPSPATPHKWYHTWFATDAMIHPSLKGILSILNFPPKHAYACYACTRRGLQGSLKVTSKMSSIFEVANSWGFLHRHQVM